MNNENLNFFIENYIKNDKTHRALMITAPWGTGKTYYIKNILCPYLETKNLEYAIVSLYGVNDIKEISKNIYIELRTKNIFGKSEKSNATKILGKTIIKGIASFFKVDISQNDNDWQALYESIDLSNKLIILEDLERCKLDILEVLSFVNNLVEQDGIKILLVANENEIIKYDKEINGDKKEKILTQKSEQYLKIKEKTIGDTIRFNPNINNSVVSIIKTFEFKSFDSIFEDTSFIQSIVAELLFVDCYNFRSLLFACQKMCEILNNLDFNLNIDYFKNMFLGIIAYSLKLNCKGSKIWNDEKTYTSYELGSYVHPLFKSSYNYIEKHVLSEEDIKKEQKLFLSYSNESKIDEEFKTIFHYYISNDKLLKNNIEFLKKMLDSNSINNYNQYIRLFNYLVSIKYNVGFEDLIDECKKLMLGNIKQAIENKYIIDVYNVSGIELITEEEKAEFDNFINEIHKFINDFRNINEDFPYDCKKISIFYDSLLKNKDEMLFENGFISRLNLSKLITTIKDANSEEINYLRRIINFIYFRFADIKQYYLCDLESLKKLLNAVEQLVDENGIDKIKKLQLKWLLQDFNKIILKIENI